MTDTFVPRDQDVRRRIRESLDETLFVEAGAGTGKTASLVDRVLELVSTGRTTLDRIAAITFNEAAATELRDRIREALEKAAVDSQVDQVARRRSVQGVEDLDQAGIQTLHGFAAEILQQRPLEAGLPPGFEVMDEIASDVEFEDRWRQWLDDALDDPTLADDLRLALSLGLSLEGLRPVARAFHENHDLLAEASFRDAPAPKGEAAAALIENGTELQRLVAFARLGDSDRLVTHVRSVLSTAGRLWSLAPGSPATYRHLSRISPVKTRWGRQADWDDDPMTGQNACTTLKKLLAELDEPVSRELEAARKRALPPVLRAVQAFVLDYVHQRKQEGRAGFQDLLVWTRDLLKDDLAVRDHFRARFTHLLIDEAQDTDPLQMEIALFLAEGSPGDTPVGDRPRVWTDVAPELGKLFVVGDPKQSIYRFRRADVAQLARMRRALGTRAVQLVQNFRSHQPAVEWVNHLFAQWMESGRGQARYIPLRHRWEVRTDHHHSPGVWSLGGEHEGMKVDQVRVIEAEDIASLVGAIRRDEWQVLDRDATEEDGVERYRSARLSDVCVLMPRRTGLRPLEIALENHDIPFRLEGASLIFNTQEVRDLLNCLRAIDDPADQVALVAALRSPAFACSDVDLLRFADQGGRFNYLDSDAESEGPVAEAFEALRRYHQERVWKPIPLLIDEFVRDQKLIEAAVAAARPRERWRRYRFLVERSRGFAESGGYSLRAFLEWAARQVEEGARITEVPVPETDEEAIRVMTVHGAKGLEFPIVILTGLNGRQSTRSDPVLFDRSAGRVEVRIGDRDARFTTNGYERASDRDKRLEAQEFVRWMYVAATRARDHLVVSTHRGGKDTYSAAARISGFMGGADSLWESLPELAPAPVGQPPSAGKHQLNEADHTIEERDRWVAERETLLAERGRPVSVGATKLAQVDKPEPEEEQRRRSRGRAGTALGRAVHAALQTVDLQTGRTLEAVARSEADAEGLADRADEIVSLVQVAIDSNVVKRALRSGRLWREAPVSAPVGDGVVDGLVDLLFEEDDGLVVVDYKTDAEDSPDATERYRLQAGAYALALQQVTGRPVKEIVLLFLSQHREVSITDIPALVEEATHAAETYFAPASTPTSTPVPPAEEQPLTLPGF